MPWREVPAATRATAAILRTFEQTARTNTRAVLTIARRISTVREALAPAEFDRWVRDALPITLRTVTNYLGLLQWSQRDPERFETLAHLGPTKLYRLAVLPARRLRRFTPGKLIAIGDDRRKRLEELTVVELDRAIGGLETPPVPQPPIGKVVAGFRHKVAGLQATADNLIARADDVDTDDAEALLDDLRDLVAKLSAAFE